MTPNEKLVMMANQIARNLEVRGPAAAVAETANHIAKFWDPRMRTAILDHLAQGGEGLGETAMAALRQLPAPGPAGK